MTKTLETLLDDINEVIQGKGGWDEAASSFLGEEVIGLAEQYFGQEQKRRDWLSPSMIGGPCDRKKWYTINENDKAEELGAEARGTFFYGHLLEAIVIAAAKAAGHDVQLVQEEVDVYGMPGAIDCVIDGWLVDVKSASSFGFKKFQDHKLREDDPFGYLSQLSSYLSSVRDRPEVVEKNKAAFLVVKKDRFKLCLDFYDLTEEIANKEAEVQAARDLVAGELPDRLDSVPQYKKTDPDGLTGNMVVPMTCNYCDFFKHCQAGNVRGFYSSTGPVWMTKVRKQPRMKEIEDDQV